MRDNERVITLSAKDKLHSLAWLNLRTFAFIQQTHSRNADRNDPYLLAL